MNALDLVNLKPLMELTNGRPAIKIGLVDGPVAIDYAGLASGNVREIPGELSGTCARAGSAACTHGTFVAGILSAKRVHYQLPGEGATEVLGMPWISLCNCLKVSINGLCSTPHLALGAVGQNVGQASVVGFAWRGASRTAKGKR